MTVRQAGKSAEFLCDGCGRAVASDLNWREYQKAQDDPEGDKLNEQVLKGLKLKADGPYHYCADCMRVRRGNPQVFVRGRALMASEVERLAKEENDAEMAAFMEGDSFKEAVRGARRDD